MGPLWLLLYLFASFFFWGGGGGRIRFLKSTTIMSFKYKFHPYIFKRYLGYTKKKQRERESKVEEEEEKQNGSKP